MISEQTSSALSRLTRGKYKLDEAALKEFLFDIKSTAVDEIVAEIFAPKPKTPKPKQATPVWLQEMQKAQKRISWKAAEATEQLYSVAANAGFQSEKPKKKSFPAAAKEIAGQLGDEATKILFVDWVNDYVSKHSMV